MNITINIIKNLYDYGHFEQLNKDFIYNNKIKIFKTIATKQILDFYFTIFKDQLFEDRNSNWLYFDSVLVFEYYEVLMNSLNRKMIISNYQPSDYIYFKKKVHSPNTVEILDMVLKNSELYELNHNFSLESFKFNILLYLANNKSKSLISILNNSKIKTFDFNFILKDLHQYPGIKYLGRWIIENCLSFIYDHNSQSVTLTVGTKNRKKVYIKMGIKLILMLQIQCGYFDQVIQSIVKEERPIFLNIFQSNGLPKFNFGIPLNFIKACIDYYVISNNEKINILVSKLILSAPPIIVIKSILYFGLNYGKNKMGLSYQHYLEILKNNSNNNQIINLLKDFDLIKGNEI
ncbi:hypothetical protein DICPUDRAFT_78328 [Dictyostelium purpureum]|uniref:Uncharacterized protein n=1 Tax=Dictyostelium purpureum TaxID=5786 RepID=F0ZJ82_DICPU|nr:uncharacterized protein DICPUDRAFT_78328 [Dictyostelium purpureum]EGC35974.1 hypothetical protein DICPUDRAFT_78328 [Dictyostelium purpureum]|eukprot:XP_003287475.1 hypothetical protein DICPUDRAFT_78328 [Dictyostelium purpureum]